MKRTLLILFILSLSLIAFKEGQKSLIQIPQNWPKPVYDLNKNPLSKESIELGRVLFYDPILSKDNSISCASCHSQYNAFTHVDHALSHGINDRIGTRNSPALMNLAWSKSFMWDGAINHLDMQSLAPISHPDEMDESIENVVRKLQSSNIYPELFKAAYGDEKITGEKTLKAISQFMLTLISANSKYDKVIRKEEKFTAQEENGYNLFKLNCSSCHNEPLFTTGEFANNGLSVDTTLNDTGRMKVSGSVSDQYKFKIPTLRNIEFSMPYMHDGRYKKLSQVIEHYTSEKYITATLAYELRSPVKLTSNEKVDLMAFLLTLSDKEFLFNPEFSYPKNILLSNSKEKN